MKAIRSLIPQAVKASGTYAAQARIDYVKAGQAWKIKQVGLLSLAQTE